MIKIFVPIIAYNHSCNTEYMMSIMRLLVTAVEKHIDIQFYPIVFDSLIQRARNSAVAFFLSNPKNTHLMFIDADIEFQPEDFFKLLESNKNIIAAGYPQKWLDINKMEQIFSSCPVPDDPLSLCTNVVMPGLTRHFTAEYVPTGFLMIKRQVFERLMETHPERHYANDIDGYMSADPKYFYDFFSVMINPDTKRYEAEDYGFCRLVREIGEKIHVIPDINLIHHGVYGFSGCLQKQIDYYG